MSVLSFREHNRIARELAAQYPAWDDDRLFETARNIMVVLLIKIVLNEYINHITPYHFQFSADPASFKNPPWHRTNWLAAEFNLVYRWHPLVPQEYRVGGREVTIHDTLYDTQMLTANGLKELYGTVDQIEFYSGLYAEDSRTNSVLPPQIGRMVGIDAFSQAFTNPMLAPRIFNEETFSPRGMEIFESTRSLSDIVHENVPGSNTYFILTRKGWRRK